jgi:hypothetical protein
MNGTVTDLNLPATPQQAAAAKLDTLGADKAWCDKLFSGDGAARKEFDQLVEQKSGGDRLDQIIAGTADVPLIQTTEGSVPLGATMRDVADLQTRVGLSADAVKQLLSGAPVSKAEYDQVKQLRADALSDADFVTRLLKNDRAAVRDLTHANIVIVGGHRESAA